MRYHELNEAIVSRPYDMRKWLAFRLKEIRKYISDFESAKKQLLDNYKKEDGDAEDTLYYCLRTANEDEVSRNCRLYISEHFYPNLVREYNLESIEQSIESMLKFGVSQFFKYFKDSLDFVRPVEGEIRIALDNLKYFQKGCVEYGYVAGEPTTDNDPVYRTMLILYDGWKKIRDTMLAIEKTISYMKTKIPVIDKINAMNFYPEKYRIDHGELEELYHATIYATDLVKDGFKPVRPDDRRGLGNMGSLQSKISFTHSYKIAHDIYRAYIDIWMIAHGQLNINRILEWMKVDGIDIAEAKRQYFDPYKHKGEKYQTLEMYNYWLWLQKRRTNPVLTDKHELMKALESLDKSSIGIIKCECVLTQKDEYFHGEEEFRLPPSSVKSIARVL